MAVHTVVGGQFGSEAKGHVAHQLVRLAETQGNGVVCVRVGGPNAGHTVVHNGESIALRTIPVGAVTPGCVLVIAPGSEIDIDVLISEYQRLTALGFDIKSRLYIDENATIIEAHHLVREVNSDINARVGSTAKGIGAARADRIMREAATARDFALELSLYGTVCDTADLMRYFASSDHISTIIEGTQGYGLGLHTRYYPQTTSGDCRSVDLLAQAGIDPNFGTIHSWVVFRTHPIRVAGNSGPLNNETTWEALQAQNPNIPTERTTVTKKVRRVGAWDSDLARRAFHANGGYLSRNAHACLMFADYIQPELYEAHGARHRMTPLLMDMTAIHALEADMNTKFDIIGTSPYTVIYNEGITL